MKRVRPTRFIGVPRVYEKIAEKMQEVGRSNKGIKKALGNWAKAAATEHNTLVREGKLKHDQGSLSYKLAHKLVLSQIHKALGLDQALNNPDTVGCGVSAAPFDVETFMYFQSLDIIVHEFFGCTETCGPQTTNMAGKLIILVSSICS